MFIKTFKRVGIFRRHFQKLLKKRVRLDVGKHCFSNRVCETNFPGEIVNAGSVDSFKGRLYQ